MIEQKGGFELDKAKGGLEKMGETKTSWWNAMRSLNVCLKGHFYE